MMNKLNAHKDMFFLVEEANGTSDSPILNYLVKTTLKCKHGGMEFFAVFQDEGDANAPKGYFFEKGRFFTERRYAKEFIDKAQKDFSVYDNLLINGLSLEQAQEWLDTLTALEYQRRADPYRYEQGAVYREYAGVQVIGERRSLKLLELMGEEEELPEYEGNHDDYFCIRVDLTEHQDESVLAHLYVKEKRDLVPVMNQLFDTFINIEVVVDSVERLVSLLAEPAHEGKLYTPGSLDRIAHNEGQVLPYDDLVVSRIGGIVTYGRATDFNLLGLRILPGQKVEEAFTDYHLAVRTSGHSEILFWARDADLLAMLAQAITVMVKKSVVAIMKGTKVQSTFFDGVQQPKPRHT